MIDLDTIKKQVKEVLEYSQEGDLCGSPAKVDELIDKWYEAKKNFIEFFNNDLICQTPDKITVDLSEDQTIFKIEKLCDKINEKYRYNYRDLVDFILRNKKDFFANILSESYIDDGYNIPAGIKLTKAFKYFVSDKDILDDIQTMASQVIQEKKITGYLCLSVHPLDYLSSSENTYNWRSCHALDGEYRAGNLSYMLDSSTIVCYVCNSKLEKLPHFPESVPWNSKKWRMLLFTSDDSNTRALFAGRQYPFFSKALLEEILERWKYLIRTHMKEDSDLVFYNAFYNSWASWHNDQLDYFSFSEHSEDDFSTSGVYIPMMYGIHNINDLITDKSKLHFNDLKHSSCYKPYYTWQKSHLKKVHFTIGSDEVPCIKCGKNHLEESEMMVCQDCMESNENVMICADCGAIIRDEFYYYIDSEDKYVCEDCYNDNYFYCPECGYTYSISDGIFDEKRDSWYCAQCYEEIEKRERE